MLTTTTTTSRLKQLFFNYFIKTKLNIQIYFDMNNKLCHQSNNEENIREFKRRLRRDIMRKLSMLSRDEIERQSVIVAEKLYQLPEFQQSKRIGLYLSMANEIQTNDIMRRCFEDGKCCFVPTYTPNGNDMHFLQLYSLLDYEQLPIEPKYRIKQPDWNERSNRPEALSTGGLDIILVPCVCYTRTGLRLGHGKGYYDRWLASATSMNNTDVNIKKPVTVGLAFIEQIVDQLPVNEFDVRIDKVIFP